MDYFLIDAVTGELRTARPLDKEAVDNPDGILKLNIKVNDDIILNIKSYMNNNILLLGS